MSVATWFLTAIALLGCKKNECEPVRKDAAVELQLAYEGVLRERLELEVDAKSAAAIQAGYSSGAERLEERFKLLEQSMDCLVHQDDCCVRLAKLTIQERTSIQSFALKAGQHEGLPVEVAGLMGPFDALTANIDAIGTGAEDPKVITPWCTKVRDAITKVRAAAPAAWKAATDAANQRTTDAKAAVLAQDALVDVVAGWARALEKSSPITLVADNAPSKEFARGHSAMERYQKACH